MIERLLELLWQILAPVVALIVAAVVAWAIRRAVRAWLEARHAGAGAPVWFLSAAVLSLACAAVALWATRTTSRWIDPFVITRLARVFSEALPPFRDLSWPYSAHWLALASISATILYSLLAVGIAWLLGPPPARSPADDRPRPRRRGLPPESAAASAREPRMGLLTALDSAASTGAVQWLYANLGYWNDPRPGAEPRYRAWVEPLHRWLGWLMWLALPVAALGLVSALVWVVAALIHDALGQILALPAEPPQDEEEPEEEAEPEPEAARALDESELISSIQQELGGAGLCVRPLGTTAAREARAGAERWPAGATGPLWESVLDQWRPPAAGAGAGAWRPWTHQLEAATQVLAGEDVLLEAPPGTGCSALCDLLAAHHALCHAGSVLVIVPYRELARRRVEALRRMGRVGGWHWIMGVHDLATDGISGLDPLVEQPEIVAGTVDALERDFMAVAGHWDLFLATLSLVVVHDVDAHDGARAASLGALCRRLLLLAADHGAAPTLLATASGSWSETTRLAEEVTSRALTVVSGPLVGAPAPSRAAYVVSGREGLSATLVERIEAAGWRAHVDGVEPSGTGSRSAVVTQGDSEGDGAPSAGHIAQVLSSSVADLPVARSRSAYLPHDATPRDRVVAFHVHQPDHPATVALLDPGRTGSPLPGWIESRPALAVGLGNPAAAAQALHRALGERESSRAELEVHHDPSATEHELSVLGQRGWLVERETAAPDPATGLPVPEIRYRLSDPAKVRIASTASVVTSDPYHLVEGSTNERLLSVDRVRAEVALYPGHVFVRRGRRYRVVHEDGDIVAEPEPQQVWTLPVRTVEVELDGWAPQRMRLGADQELFVGRGPVALRFELSGVRRFGPDGELRAEQLLGNPRRTAYPAKAAVLRLPEAAAGGAVHGLAHAMRAALPFVLRAGPLDVDVIALDPDEAGRPGVALLDLHPFGAGFTEPMRSDAMRRWLELSLALLREEPAPDGQGPCASPVGRWEVASSDAAKDLLEALVGDTLPAA